MLRFIVFVSTLLGVLLPMSVHAQSAQIEDLIYRAEEAMGGREAYDNTRYIEWTFFGSRHLLWDKWTGDVRIDFTDKEDVFIVNINEGQGKIWLDGERQSHPDTLQKYTQRAKSIWINDSYWLVMPWKLRDPGVNLKFLEPEADSYRQRLELTFESVGDTPDNKYIIYFDSSTGLVNEWQFFAHYDDAEPRFSTPWADYERYGDILLSGNRGKGKLTNIATPQSVAPERFTAFE